MRVNADEGGGGREGRNKIHIIFPLHLPHVEYTHGNVASPTKFFLHFSLTALFFFYFIKRL
jgi:hypothetical protein